MLVGDTLMALVVVANAVVLYDVAVMIPRKMGLTKRKGYVTRLAESLLYKLVGYRRNDYGEFRSDAWREANRGD